MNRHSDLEELDPFGIARIIWSSKVSIILLTLLGFLCSAVFLFTMSPLYEARVFVLPPTQNGIADLNYGRTKEAELSPYTVKDVYDVFLRNLQAESLRRSFFSNHYLQSLSPSERKRGQDDLYSEFLESIKVVPTAQSSSESYSIVFRGDNPVQASEWAKLYVQQAEEAAKKEVITNVYREVEVRARDLKQQIVTLRDNSQKVREDLIVQLREALTIADSIGLKEPPILSGGLGGEVSANMTGQLTYMRGSRALRAEIETLRSRQSDDPFISELRLLQLKYSFFNSFEVFPESLSVYRQDGPIETPDTPVKTKTNLILAIGSLLGLMIGVIISLVRRIFEVPVK